MSFLPILIAASLFLKLSNSSSSLLFLLRGKILLSASKTLASIGEKGFISSLIVHHTLYMILALFLNQLKCQGLDVLLLLWNAFPCGIQVLVAWWQSTKYLAHQSLFGDRLSKIAKLVR
jgi:hypothetical protein